MGSSVQYVFHITDHESLYSGRVFGETKSSVRAHIENKIITANIILPDETYHIEVSATDENFKKKNHLNEKHSLFLNSHHGDMYHTYPIAT